MQYQGMLWLRINARAAFGSTAATSGQNSVAVVAPPGHLQSSAGGVRHLLLFLSKGTAQHGISHAALSCCTAVRLYCTVQQRQHLTHALMFPLYHLLPAPSCLSMCTDCCLMRRCGVSRVTKVLPMSLELGNLWCAPACRWCRWSSCRRPRSRRSCCRWVPDAGNGCTCHARMQCIAAVHVRLGMPKHN